MKKPSSALVLTAALGALAMVVSGCSSSGTDATQGASVDGDAVSLSTDNCPTDATDKLADGEEIVIGTSAALTGPVSAASKDSTAAVEAYFAKVNAAGGVDGHPLKFESKDDAYEAARAVTNVKELIQTDKVMATLLQLGTAQSAAVQSQHESSCTPQLYVSAGAPSFYDPQQHQFSTSSFFPYSANGTLMVDFIEKEYPKGAEVGELVWNNEFGEAASKAFESAAKDSSVTVVATAKHDTTAVSLSSQVTSLLSKSPDVLVASTGSSFCSQLVGTARDKGFDGPIVLPNACSDASNVLDPLGDKATNVHAGQSLVDPNGDVDSEGVTEYKAWLKEYGSKLDAQSSHVRTGYQVAALLVEQLNRAAESEDGLSRVGLMKSVWSTDSEIGLNFPGQKTTINGEFPFPTGYAVMSEYDPKTMAWREGDVAVLANGDQP